MPPKRNDRRTTHMTEEEIDTLMNLPLACFRSDGVLAVQAKKKAQAREEADREGEILWAREAAANRMKEDAREAKWIADRKWTARMRADRAEEAVRVAKAVLFLENWRATYLDEPGEVESNSPPSPYSSSSSPYSDSSPTDYNPFFSCVSFKWTERPLKHQREQTRKNTFLPAGWRGSIGLPAPYAADN